MSTPGTSIANLLADWQAGDTAALEQLAPMVYADLRMMAASELRQHRGHGTLQPTALVNELFVRLLGASSLHLVDRTHFFNNAARIMRQILVDHARRTQADKRGGGWIREDFHTSLELPIPEHYRLDEVDDALVALEHLDNHLSNIVELRFFGGLSVAEIAIMLDKDERTVYRHWATAKAWLKDRLQH